MKPTPEVRAKILQELQAGVSPLEVAHKFKLSLVTIGEIADPKGKGVVPKKPAERMR